MSGGLEQIERAIRAIFETRAASSSALRSPNIGQEHFVAIDVVLRQLRAASTGGRQLDCEIHLAVNKLDETLRDTLELANYLGVPHYTTSLDDARKLVPDDTYFVIAKKSAAVARLEPGAFVYHSVPAIALVIAALEARQEGR